MRQIQARYMQGCKHIQDMRGDGSTDLMLNGMIGSQAGECWVRLNKQVVYTVSLFLIRHGNSSMHSRHQTYITPEQYLFISGLKSESVPVMDGSSSLVVSCSCLKSEAYSSARHTSSTGRQPMLTYASSSPSWLLLRSSVSASEISSRSSKQGTIDR